MHDIIENWFQLITLKKESLINNLENNISHKLL